MIEYKEMYTFEELCRGLEISMSQFSKKANVDEGTIMRVRQGKPTRLSTANKLLRAFSEIYEVKFSLDNVSGLMLQNSAIDKPATSPVSTSMPSGITENKEAQISPTTRKPGGAPLSGIPDDLPPCTIKLIDFSEKYGLPQANMNRWYTTGIKGEKIETTMRTRPSGGGRQHFLTPEQQEKALEFLIRHGKLKTSQPEQEEKPIEEERPWYAPDGQ